MAIAADASCQNVTRSRRPWAGTRPSPSYLPLTEPQSQGSSHDRIATHTGRVLGPNDGQILGMPEVATDRFMIDSADTGGRFALVEHVLSPRVLAAPLHLHTLEDEYSYVLEGRVGALLGDAEVLAGPGDLISSRGGSGTRSGTPGRARRGFWSSSRRAVSKSCSGPSGHSPRIPTPMLCQRSPLASAARQTSRRRCPSSSDTA